MVNGEPVTIVPFGGGVHMHGYVLLGGQNGTWFKNGQYPKLSKINLGNLTKENLEPDDPDGQGTVWSGGWNGTQWLVAGWGVDSGVNGSNPYLYLYDGQRQVPAGSTDQYKAESTWRGGAVFCVSYNGHEWLLSGLGSGYLPRFGDTNHMSLATFNGTTFTDYSSKVPNQYDYILYANAWNGKYWLVGGGLVSDGILFSFNGSATIDLTKEIQRDVPSFGAVQALAWNGVTWLIGGNTFLADFDGVHFHDLTSSLVGPLGISKSAFSVNAIVWDQGIWIIGGGSTRARVGWQPAWLVEYGVRGVQRLPLPALMNEGKASILSVAVIGSLIVAGGYANSHGVVVTYSNENTYDLSYLIENDMSYVNWVAVRE
jgi:hypothetical protein